jgi:hypothetical protein
VVLNIPSSITRFAELTAFAVDCSRLVFRLESVERKTDYDTKVPSVDEHGRELYVVSVLVKGPGDDRYRSERVTVPGPLPQIDGDLPPVSFPGLVLRAWENKAKGIWGVSLRADKLVVVSGGVRS